MTVSKALSSVLAQKSQDISMLALPNLIHSADDAAWVAQAIPNFSKMTTLEIDGAKLGDGALAPILAALPASNVRRLILKNCELSAADMDALGQTLEACPGVRTLDISGNSIGDAGMAALAPHLDASGVQCLMLNQCRMGQDGVATLAGVVKESDQLLMIETEQNPGTNAIGEGYASVLEALIQNRSVVQWKFRKFSMDGSFQSDPETEQRYADLERRFFAEGSRSLQEFNPMTSVGVAGKLGEANKRMAAQILRDIRDGGYQQENLPLPLRKAVFERLPILVAYARFPDETMQIGDYDKFQKTMPVIGPEDAPSLETLFAEDAKGHTPLDNPQTWINHPQLLEQVMADVDDGKAVLRDRQTPQAMRLQDYALTMIGAEEVINQLNRVGILVQKDLLLDESGQPNDLLRAVMKQGATAALFHEENWEEGTQGGLNAVLNALPDFERAKIPNLHGLRAHISRQQKAERAVG